MPAHKSYQGHRNYNAWNVCLYIFNEEPFYREAQKSMRISRRVEDAARRLLRELPSHTPDGVPFTYTNVRLALQNWGG